MIVTKIEELSKSRSRVFVDGEFAFVLYKGELRQYQIRPQEELSEAAYEEILGTVLPKRARLRAMNLLMKKDYTTAGLREKLREGGYPESILEDALAYVASFHYTDDLRYAVDYIACQQEQRSRMRIEQDLLKKGISREVLGQAWERWEEEGGRQDEAAMIERLLQKRNFDAQHSTPSERQKQYAFLMRRGFSQETARKAVFGRFDGCFD